MAANSSMTDVFARSKREPEKLAKAEAFLFELFNFSILKPGKSSVSLSSHSVDSTLNTIESKH